MTKLLVEKNYTTIVDRNDCEQTVIPTSLFLSHLMTVGLNELDRPTMSCILPNNCKGIVVEKNKTLYILEFPPAFHKITINSTLQHLNDNMLDKFSIAYPQSKYSKRKNIFKLLFPYVIFQIVFGDNHSTHSVRVFLSDRPISSFDSPVQLMPLPNIYKNQVVCMPEDSSLHCCENQVDICNKLVNNFWSSEYNSDLVYNLEDYYLYEGGFSLIHTNYYIWEYESINNPAKVLGHEFSPKFNLLKFTKKTLQSGSSENITLKKISDNIVESFTGDAAVGTLDRLKEINKKHDIAYNGVEKCITFSNEDDHITINLQDEFVMKGIRYILVNIISVGRDYEKSIIELVPKGNYNIIYSISLKKMNEEMVDDIITNKLKEKNLIITEFEYNNQFISEGDEIVAINKFKSKAMFFIFRERVNNIAGNYVLKSTSDDRYSDALYDFYLKKNIKGYVVNGITIRKNKKLTIYTKKNNLCFEEENSFTVDDSTISFDYGRIKLNDSLTCNFDKMKNNYMFLSLNKEHSIVDHVSLSHKIKTDFILKSSHIIYGKFLTLDTAGRKHIVMYADTNNRVVYDNFNMLADKFDNLIYYVEIETKLRSLNKGDLVVIPKWESSDNLTLLYCVIDGFVNNEDEISINLTVCNEKTKLKLIIINKYTVNNTYIFKGDLIRKAVLEVEDYSVGDYIEKISPTRFAGLNMNESYRIEGIITDCSTDDKLIILSNNQTLWLKTVKAYFTNVGSAPSKNISSVKTKLVDAFNDGRPDSLKTLTYVQDTTYGDAYGYGIPSPRIFKLQRLEGNFQKFYN